MLISAKVDFAAMFIIELLKITFWYNFEVQWCMKSSLHS